MKRAVVVLAALSAGACARSAPLTVTPSPEPVAAQADSASRLGPVTQSGAPAVVRAGAPVAQRAAVDTALPAVVLTLDSSAAITKQAIEVFGDSAISAPRDSSTPGAGPTWDMDVRSYETMSRVERYVRMFTGSAKEHIETQLGRGSQYEPMIRAALRDGGLPEDLYYLGLVESGFDPNAYSKAAAVGMWQFMASTARDMGLRVDWWVDERRDPVRSTHAAVRFIKGLREQFGSLYLAAAAYNGGPGRIERGLTRYADDLDGRPAEDQFFVLADKKVFRPETRDYVPQLIAVALVAKDPARYGLEVQTRQPVVYDSVLAPAGTPLAAIAKAADTTVAAIRALNPQILRGMTPPGDSIMVRVPAGRAATLAAVLDSLPESDRVGLQRTESKKGESLSSVAKREHRTTRALAQFNPKLKRLKSGNLAPGQTVLVPSPSVIAAALSVPDPSIERYPRSRSAGLHVVMRGETLGGIALAYHVTTSALMSANGLRRALIFPGQSLVIPKRG